MLKRNGMVSALCFIGFLAAETPHISVAEALVLLSILIFVPGIFPFVFYQPQFRAAQSLESALMKCYPAAAIFAVLALVTDIGGFALIWWMYTVFMALYAILASGKQRYIESKRHQFCSGLSIWRAEGFGFLLMLHICRSCNSALSSFC